MYVLYIYTFSYVSIFLYTNTCLVYLQVESDDHPRQEPALVEFGSRIRVD